MIMKFEFPAKDACRKRVDFQFKLKLKEKFAIFIKLMNLF